MAMAFEFQYLISDLVLLKKKKKICDIYIKSYLY